MVNRSISVSRVDFTRPPSRRSPTVIRRPAAGGSSREAVAPGLTDGPGAAYGDQLGLLFPPVVVIRRTPVPSKFIV
jgi:hypothetical protein